jgi:hypothetical protein
VDTYTSSDFFCEADDSGLYLEKFSLLNEGRFLRKYGTPSSFLSPPSEDEPAPERTALVGT